MRYSPLNELYWVLQAKSAGARLIVSCAPIAWGLGMMFTQARDYADLPANPILFATLMILSGVGGLLTPRGRPRVAALFVLFVMLALLSGASFVSGINRIPGALIAFMLASACVREMVLEENGARV